MLTNKIISQTQELQSFTSIKGKSRKKISRIKNSIISCLTLGAIHSAMKINLMANPANKEGDDSAWYDFYREKNPINKKRNGDTGCVFCCDAPFAWWFRKSGDI